MLAPPLQDELDPTEDCFCIRMVITLLETCGHYFDRGSSKRKLNRFLIHFQRYILSKGALPLDIEFDLQALEEEVKANPSSYHHSCCCIFWLIATHYIVDLKPNSSQDTQDLFADLHPKMTRYSSIEEVNAVLVELEEYEPVSTDKANSEKHSDTEKPRSRSTSVSISVNGQFHANGIEENGRVHEAMADSESDSESCTIDPEGHDEEEDLDEGNHDDVCDSEDDYEERGGLATDEDEEVHVRQRVIEVDPQEEAKFEKKLRALMQESLDSRKLELRARPMLNMMIPMNVFEGPMKDHHGRGFEGESGNETLDEEAGGRKAVRVKVLVKRGNKQQTKQMFIPRDCSFVQSTKQKKAAELEEKQDIKRLVLEYNDREEEELNGLGQQSTGWTQSGVSRAPHQAHTWEGHGGRSGHRYLHYSGGGIYYSRRK